MTPNKIDYISPGISNEKTGKINIKVFCISHPGDRELYEEIINDENSTVLEEFPPVFDKAGRALIILKWI